MPWRWSFNFSISEFQYFFDVSAENVPSTVKQKTKPNQTIKYSEVILAKLTPLRKGKVLTSFSMFGTNQKIKDFQLRVEMVEEESIHIYGNTECIEVHLYLTKKIFDKIADLVKLKQVNAPHLFLSGVSGFYSDWSPDTSTESIKIFTSPDDHGLEVSENFKITPPCLGKVNEFNLVLGSNIDQELSCVEEDRAWVDEMTSSWIAEKCRDYEYMLEEDDEYTENQENIQNSDLDKDEVSITGKAASTIADNIPDFKEIFQYSKQRLIYEELIINVSIYASKNNLSQNSRDKLYYDIVSLMSDLEEVFIEGSWSDYKGKESVSDHASKAAHLWSHQRVDLEKVKKGEIPWIGKLDLFYVLEGYLALPVRSRKIDRMFVDALVAAEIFQYAKQSFYLPDYLEGLSTSPFARSHPLLLFDKDLSWLSIVILGIPVGILFGLDQAFHFQGNWLFWAGSFFVGLWLLMSAIRLVALPYGWISDRKDKQKTENLLNEMTAVYLELDGGGMISASHIRDRLSKTTEMGVIWPDASYPLLDDIIARDGRM